MKIWPGSSQVALPATYKDITQDLERMEGSIDNEGQLVSYIRRVVLIEGLGGEKDGLSGLRSGTSK